METEENSARLGLDAEKIFGVTGPVHVHDIALQVAQCNKSCYKGISYQSVENTL